MPRKMCQACHRRLSAVNYHHKDKIYYRSRCDKCIRNCRPITDPVPAYVKSGYQLRDRCELCNFKSRTPNQIRIWYINGDHTDGNWQNLRSICANCELELIKKKVRWINIRPDF